MQYDILLRELIDCESSKSRWASLSEENSNCLIRSRSTHPKRPVGREGGQQDSPALLSSSVDDLMSDSVKSTINSLGGCRRKGVVAKAKGIIQAKNQNRCSSLPGPNYRWYFEYRYLKFRFKMFYSSEI
ncbi:hypothetical protein CEXT_733351 [Caerostris extrusa]|uniref:Uncharacterized protein n=1 Tax=Caerostris extrusa TaxID=172846 RepID=A0AAV4S2V8_CAEEX|nr:hypothetical protein CEXT_733351 [Caerostris extrusa]